MGVEPTSREQKCILSDNETANRILALCDSFDKHYKKGRASIAKIHEFGILCSDKSNFVIRQIISCYGGILWSLITSLFINNSS